MENNSIIIWDVISYFNLKSALGYVVKVNVVDFPTYLFYDCTIQPFSISRCS